MENIVPSEEVWWQNFCVLRFSVRCAGRVHAKSVFFVVVIYNITGTPKTRGGAEWGASCSFCGSLLSWSILWGSWSSGLERDKTDTINMTGLWSGSIRSEWGSYFNEDLLCAQLMWNVSAFFSVCIARFAT